MRASAPGWGKRIPVCTVAASAFVLLISGGCAHTTSKRLSTHISEPTLLPLTPKEEAKLDQRVDGLAHYAAGISDELNSRQKEATEEFLKAAFDDIRQEGLVLE